jgi:hypothetical protein
MTRINTINMRISGIDLNVETIPEGGGSSVEFVPWTEQLSLTQWQTNTGLTALQYINPQDSTSVVLGVPDLADLVNDKTANNHDVDFDGLSRLANRTTTNGIIAETSAGLNTSAMPSISGNSWSNPFILAYCFEISRAPTSTETLYCHGSSSADVFMTIDITTNRYLQYTYKDDSGNTLTKTASTAVPYDKKMLLIAFLERSKVRIFLHGDSFDHSIQITNEGAFNTTSTLTTQAINCKYASGSTSQQRTSGYYYGHLLAEGVSTKTFDIIENCCNLLGVPFALTDISTLDTGLISLMQSPGAGNLATPKADVVDLISGLTFTATGTIPTAGDGKFHKALNLTNVASSIFTKATVPAIWDIYSGSYGDYTLYIRYKTGTLDTSTRNIICLNTTGAPTTQNVRIQLAPTTSLIALVVDNSTKATTTVAAASDTWYDIVVKGASGVHTFSVNGETPITFTPGTRSTVGGYFGLGAMLTAASTIQYPGRGYLDVVSLHSRALSADEIIQLRRGGDGLDGMFNYLTQYDGGGGDPPSQTAEFRGTQCAVNTNNNVYLCGSTATGSGATYLSFIPPRSGRIRKITAWWKTRNNAGDTGDYSRGTGGTYTLSVRTDNAGVPSSTVVCEQTGITGWSLDGDTAADYKTTTLTTQNALVTAGTQYHLSIINTDGNPTLNWSCMNTSDLYPSTNRAVSSPTMNNTTDFAVRLGYGKNRGGPFNNYTTYQGVLNLVFHIDTDDSGTADFWFGFPATSCFSGNTRAVSTAFGGTTRIRQILPIASGDDFDITAINVALTRSGSAGDITARILASNGTTVLATTTISSSEFPSVTISTTSQPSWGRGALSSPLTITGGNTYYLELYSSSTSYYPVAIQDAQTWLNANGGTDPGISGISGVRGGWYGSNGKLESSSNSGSSYGTYMNGDKDLGFYFEVLV